MFRHVAFGFILVTAAALAQPPVINPRGVLNALTLEPAPSRVAPGGLLLIQGINFGSATDVKASGLPWPTQLGDPPVQVLINNRPAPIFSVSTTRILVQVPWETQAGGGQGNLTNVVVRRGDQQSRAATFRVVNVLPSTRTKNELGFGDAGQVDGKQLLLSVSGLGLTEPRVDSGEGAPADPPVSPRATVRAYVGGLPAAVNATLSKGRVGEFDVAVTVPDDAKPGDVVSIDAGPAPGNRTLFGKPPGADVQFLRMPAGGDTIATLRTADLRGNYVVGNAARGADGCYNSWIFDFGRSRAAKIDQCLVTAQQNAATPFITLNENPALTSFVGPARGDAQSGLSAKVAVFQPARPDTMVVDLPAPASNLIAGQDGSVLAITATTPPTAYQVDTVTGEVTEAQIGGAGGGFGLPGGGGGGGGAGGGFAIPQNLMVDLGDGVKELVTIPVNLGQGALGAVAVDNSTTATKAKMGILNAQGAVTGTRDFPAGWLPLLAPQAAPAPGGGGQGGGGGFPGAPGGGANFANLFRVSNQFDQATRTWFILARKPGGADGFVIFSGPQLEAGVIEFPAGWFAASCVAQIPLFNLDLSRRIALFGAARAEPQINNNCLAQGYINVDLATRRATATALPGNGQANLGSPNGEVNDYLYSSNRDPGNPTISDTLYVFDSVAGSVFRLDLPSGVTGFSNVQPQAALNGLLAVATNRVAGDSGFVFFDLENERQIQLYVPDGFSAINLIGVFPGTRKVVARANKTDGSGSQFVIYDLLSQEPTIVPNPAGVAFVGQLPAAGGGGGGAPGGGGGGPPGGGFPPGGGPPGGGGIPGGGGAGGGQAAAQVQIINQKSGFVSAIGYDARRTAIGVLAVRVP